jgi:hypothetical protein
VPLCGTTERTAQPAARITGPTVQCLEYYGNSSGDRFVLCCSVNNLLPLTQRSGRLLLSDPNEVTRNVMLSVVHCAEIICFGKRLLVNQLTTLYVKY